MDVNMSEKRSYVKCMKQFIILTVKPKQISFYGRQVNMNNDRINNDRITQVRDSKINLKFKSSLNHEILVRSFLAQNGA